MIEERGACCWIKRRTKRKAKDKREQKAKTKIKTRTRIAWWPQEGWWRCVTAGEEGEEEECAGDTGEEEGDDEGVEASSETMGWKCSEVILVSCSLIRTQIANDWLSATSLTCESHAIGKRISWISVQKPNFSLHPSPKDILLVSGSFDHDSFH